MGLPVHRIDGDMLFVSEKDDAWDHEKIRQDRSAAEDGEQTAWDRWYSGATRFDSRTFPKEYLKDGADPVYWHMRRLPWQAVTQIQDQVSSVLMKTRALVEAFAHGLKRADGLKLHGGQDVDWPGNHDGKHLSNADVQLLVDVLGIDVVLDVGRAVFLASMPLNEDEKKR